jgi:cell division topological specificity factor
MKLFNLFRSSSAPIARERLQILLAHERSARSSEPDLLAVLREEILAVIGRHVAFEPDKVQIKLDRGKSVSTLAVDIEIPNGSRIGGIAPQFSRLTLDGGASSMNKQVA